jgi:hypothetical protein
LKTRRKWFEKAVFSATAQNIRLLENNIAACQIAREGAAQISIPIPEPMR